MFKDLSGKKFGLLTVSNEYKHMKNYIYWKCVCNCGREVWVRGTNLSYGTTKSCGHHTKSNFKHGQADTRLYGIYYGMLQRCNNPNSSQYENYGERGITVCDEWSNEDGFIHFYNWAIANGYSDNLTIEREDVNGNYEPSNCKWATLHEQSRNRRSNVHIDVNGTDMIIADASVELNIPQKTLGERIKKGWAAEDVIDETKPKPRIVTYQGKEITLDKLSTITGVNINTLETRFTKGYSDEELIKKPYSSAKIPVIQYDDDGNIIGKYESSADASRITGIRKSGIIMCCNGQRKHCGGYIWKHDPCYEPPQKIKRSLHRKEGGGWKK